jgi:segregation and condensation protein B
MQAVDIPQEVSEEVTSTPETDGAEFTSQVEALLLVSDRPMPEQRIAELLEIEHAEDPGEARQKAVQSVRHAIEELNKAYEESGRAFRIMKLAGGHQMMTLPKHGDLLARLRGERQLQKLTPAALETLAIIAYRQPILRADLESIRGVACGEVLRGLLERRLVRITGRAEEIGRPMLYGTTKEFLQIFGLGSLKDLPKSEDL